MRAHAGVHPCMGAVDLVPIYPLGEEVGVEDCAEEARGEERNADVTSDYSNDLRSNLLREGAARVKAKTCETDDKTRPI